MSKTTLTLAAVVVSAVALIAPMSAVAAEATYFPADTNKDGSVSRQEHLDHASMMWDKHHGDMMKADKTMKADMMDGRQYSSFYKKLYLPDGRVNPGKVGGN